MRGLRLSAVIAALLAVIAVVPAAAHEQESDYAADARALEGIIAENYAYLDRFEGGNPPRSARLDAMRDAVDSDSDLLAYAEAALLALADHHAITGSSFADSWAVVPSFADLWIVREADRYRVDAVRAGSPAAQAGISVGAELIAIGDAPIGDSVQTFWTELGLMGGHAERDAFAARVLAAGRRDRARDLTFRADDGSERRITLASLYAVDRSGPAPLTMSNGAGGARIVLHNALGDEATIAAFDAAMASLAGDAPVEIDLTDTPGGGNTVVARAILGWFVDRPVAYQVHRYPAEERRTGIARQWIEQVLPRDGKHHAGPVTVRVGRWTGSMGEGLAIGFDTIGAKVVEGEMAGLLGAVYDFRLPESGLVVKLPAERLLHVDGTPRERFTPETR